MKGEVADEAGEVGRGQFMEDAYVILKNLDFILGNRESLKMLSRSDTMRLELQSHLSGRKPYTGLIMMIQSGNKKSEERHLHCSKC